jgi:hypothetical protein
MRSLIAKLALSTALVATSFAAQAEMRGIQGGRMKGLDHIFVIMMENQPETAIIGNANAPFLNSYAKSVNFANNYWAVGHPSAVNYLEIVGGSNFHVASDYWPAWQGAGCVDNAPGSTGCVNAVPPIASVGTDIATVATAVTSADCNGQLTITGAPAANNCALYNYPAATYQPKSIADQLVAARKTWKTYQESLPTLVPGVFGVNYSDGVFSNLSPAAAFNAGAGTPPAATSVQKLYAVKHNPFAYFANIQSGANDDLSLSRVQDFDGPDGLWADLQRPEKLPNFSLVVPNQCHDMHSAGGGAFVCSASTAAEAGLLMQEADAAVAKLVYGIKASPAWNVGRNAIVVVFDENDYSNAANHVYFTTELNFAPNGTQSSAPYDHFSLLRTMETAFGLQCLNHACDATSKVMTDMFGNGQ